MRSLKSILAALLVLLSAKAAFACKSIENALLSDELSTERLQQELEAGADPNCETSEGRLLHTILEYKPSPDLISTLLRNGADPNIQAGMRLPLELALNKRARNPVPFETVIVLMKGGADPNLSSVPLAIGAPKTAFMRLLQEGVPENMDPAAVIDVLVRYGADLSAHHPLYNPITNLPDDPPVYRYQIGDPAFEEQGRKLIELAFDAGATFAARRFNVERTILGQLLFGQSSAALISKALQAGAEPCIFDPKIADMESVPGAIMSDGWPNQWNYILNNGLEQKLGSHPAVLSNLIETKGVCQVNE